MTALLASGLGVAALVGGFALLCLWIRARLLGHRGLGGAHPRCLEVVSRVGLNANQGLAVVRVGRRHILVSSGEGGARMITELSEDDLDAPAVEARPDFRSTLRLHVGRVPGRARTALLVAGLLAAAAGPVLGQTPRPDIIPPPGDTGDPLGAVVDPLGRGVDAFGNPIVPYARPPAGIFGPVFQALPGVAFQMGEEEEGLRLTGTVGTVVILGLMALAPSLLLLTTSFTRIFIVLQLLRQALGTQNTPPGHLLAAMALLLTTAVMAPTFEQVRVLAVQPWVEGQIEEGEMLVRATGPLRQFMLVHTREPDLRMFLEISRTPPPLTPADIPNTVLMSAFVTSELRTAFEIGFAIFLPFIVIDLVVAAVLTSMGMFMLPPTMIALPCKLMLFVLMDGWALLMGTLARSFV